MQCQYCQKTRHAVEVIGFTLCKACSNELKKLHAGEINPVQHAYIYLRVSTPSQNEDPNSGLFIQLRQCIEYCFAHALRCESIYQDVHSAWKMRNTGLVGLHEMINDLGFDIFLPKQCKSKIPLVKKLSDAIRDSEGMVLIREDEPETHIDYILVANLDRMGRDLQNLLTLRQYLQKYGTQFVSVQQKFQTGNDIGDMEFFQKALEAEMFSRDRSKRIKDVIRAKRALGSYVGPRPRYGYTTRSEEGVRHVIPDPIEQENLKLIKKLKEKGYTTEQIVDKLNEKSTKRGAEWTPTNIRSLLTVDPDYPKQPKPVPVPEPMEEDTTDTDSDA
jgi:DNA invertase Pin-like site-specific DNA recombinase